MDRVLAERGDDLLAHRRQRALGDVLADQVDRRDQRLGLDRQQPRRTRERVAVRLGVDLDRAVGVDLGVQHVRAGAEVDDVQHRDVLAQLLLGDLQRRADLGRASAAVPAAAGLDQDARERHQPREPLGPDRGVGPAAVGVVELVAVGVVRRSPPAQCPRSPGRRSGLRRCGARPAARAARAARRRAPAGRRSARSRRARAPRRSAGGRWRTGW